MGSGAGQLGWEQVAIGETASNIYGFSIRKTYRGASTVDDFWYAQTKQKVFSELLLGHNCFLMCMASFIALSALPLPHEEKPGKISDIGGINTHLDSLFVGNGNWKLPGKENAASSAYTIIN